MSMEAQEVKDIPIPVKRDLTIFGWDETKPLSDLIEELLDDEFKALTELLGKEGKEGKEGKGITRETLQRLIKEIKDNP